MNSAISIPITIGLRDIYHPIRISLLCVSGYLENTQPLSKAVCSTVVPFHLVGHLLNEFCEGRTGVGISCAPCEAQRVAFA